MYNTIWLKIKSSNNLKFSIFYICSWTKEPPTNFENMNIMLSTFIIKNNISVWLFGNIIFFFTLCTTNSLCTRNNRSFSRGSICSSRPYAKEDKKKKGQILNPYHLSRFTALPVFFMIGSSIEAASDEHRALRLAELL